MSRVPTTTSTILLTFLALTTAASSMASRSAEPRADVVFREAASEPPTGALADPLVFSAARRDSTEMVTQSQRATTGRNARLAPVSEAPSSRSRATRGLNSDPEMSISAPTVESGARDPAQGSGVDAAIRDRYDRDGDTIADMFDNCLEDGNREQADSDRDGYGNLCDGDYDGDGVVGPADFDVFESAYGKHAGESGFLEIADADGDGVIGVADAVAFRSQFSRGVPGPGAPTFTLAEPGTFHEEWREGNVTLAYSNRESECVGGQAHHRIELSAVNHGQETVEILLTLRSADPDLRFKTARAGLTDETHVYLGAADPGSTPDDKPTFEVVHDCSRGFDFELVKWIPLVTIANQDPSIRILTWNIAFIPDSKNVAEATWEDDEARAKFVVNKLLKEGHGQLDADIIVINEAFNEEAKDALSDGLCGPYPSFVRQLVGTVQGAEIFQDSGLMLFSRHPFMGLNFADKEYYAPTAASGWHASEAFTGCPDKIGISDKKFFHQVGFIEYPLVTELAQAAVGCGGLDCLADKGVGAVRVEHKTTEEPINLIFTHMQANDEGIDRAVRAKQFDIMEELIDAIPKWEEQRSFVMGDFNVKGKGCSGGSCSLPEHPGDEWMKHFAGKDKGIFHGGMLKDGGDGSHFTESWGYEMPSEDLGRTHTGHQGTLFPDYTYGHRYDYILHNIPQQRWSCLQHMRVLRHWSDAKGTQASDHLPVWAEFNYWAPHCNPLEAKPAQPAEGQSDFQHAGKIQYGQSVQWLRIDEAGTYSLSASDTVNLEVYEATDMSYPIGPYHGEKSRYGDVYRLDAPPYYIKVKAKSPHFTGGYDFKLHQHACGKGDACELTPGDPDGTWANWQKGVVNSPSRWFGFYTDKGETGTYPAISFAQEAACSENLRMNLWTARMQNGHLVPDEEFGEGWETYESCDYGQECDEGVLHNDQKVTAHDLEPGKYFIEVDRGPGPFKSNLCATKLNFFTTLTYLWFDAPEGEDNASLTCHDETGDSGTLEEWGEDEISTHLIVDGSANCEASSDKNDYKFFSSFEEDDSPNKGLAELGNHIYTNCFSLNLMEKDSSSEFYLGPKKPEFFLEVNVKKEVQKRHWGQNEVNWDNPIDGYDYFYYMTYQLSHEDLSKSEKDY